MDIDPLIIEAEARERQAAEQAAYARGYADALRALRAALVAAQQPTAPSDEDEEPAP
jgi:hypothetical protein